MRDRCPSKYLISEYVAGQLAIELGLEIPPFDRVTLSDETLCRELGAASSIAFASKFISGQHPWYGNPVTLRQIINPEMMTGIIVLDTWLLNRDRFSKECELPLRTQSPAYRNVFLSRIGPETGALKLYAIDQTHCFEGDIFQLCTQSAVPWLESRELFGNFPSWRDYITVSAIDEYCHKLQSLHPGAAASILRRVPGDWRISQDDVRRISDWIMRRAEFLGRHLKLIMLDKYLCRQESLPWARGV